MATSDVYRDGKLHVLAEKCSSCIFRPNERPVPGARVAEMIRGTQENEGGNVPCHQTLYGQTDHNAICRGFWDRFADRDPLFRLAVAMDIVVEDAVPEH